MSKYINHPPRSRKSFRIHFYQEMDRENISMKKVAKQADLSISDIKSQINLSNGPSIKESTIAKVIVGFRLTSNERRRWLKQIKIRVPRLSDLYSTNHYRKGPQPLMLSNWIEYLSNNNYISYKKLDAKDKVLANKIRVLSKGSNSKLGQYSPNERKKAFNNFASIIDELSHNDFVRLAKILFLKVAELRFVINMDFNIINHTDKNGNYLSPTSRTIALISNKLPSESQFLVYITAHELYMMLCK